MRSEVCLNFGSLLIDELSQYVVLLESFLESGCIKFGADFGIEKKVAGLDL